MPNETKPGAWLLAGRQEGENLVSCQRQSTLESSPDSFTFSVSPKRKRLRPAAMVVAGYREER